MNRPTDELENLLSMADDAMADNDFDTAVGILREANSIAPLRRDIRNRLAVALERAPGPIKSKPAVASERAPSFSEDIYFEEDEPSLEADRGEYEGAAAGVDQISGVARKAFKAASGTTARATEATRSLTNLLQSGISSWRSSLMDQVRSARSNEKAARQARIAAAESMGGTAEDGLFTPAAELDTLITKPLSGNVSHFMPAADRADQASTEAAEVDRMTRPVPVSQKAGKSQVSKKSSSRPTDVEDVLAAGIGGFIEVLARTERKKFVYAGVYMLLGGLFAFACFDTSRKFPGVQAVPALRSVEGASLSVLDLSASSDDVVAEARQLAQMGKPTQAINLLKNKLVSGTHGTMDAVRIELAAQLNALAEAKLRSNHLAESTDIYREAVGVLPQDSALSLRLANALYYQGVMGGGSADERQGLLSEAEEILTRLLAGGSEDMQVHRVLALVHEAKGDTSQAKASWQKVKSMAGENTPEHKEAVSRLK